MTTAPKPAAHYLRRMTHFARLLNQAEGHDAAAWAADKRYIRVNGGGLRPISLCAMSPCGALKDHGTRQTVDGLPGAREALIKQPDKKRRKPEHRVQAALIEHAHRWPAHLPSLLHLQDLCEELRFVTDELKVEDIRADVVLIGRKGSVWFPIFIELKFRRAKKELLGQLEAIVGKVSTTDTAEAFVEFLKEAACVDGSIDLAQSVRLFIWPAAKGRPKDLTDTVERGIRVLEFDKHRTLPDDLVAPVLSFRDATLRPG